MQMQTLDMTLSSAMAISLPSLSPSRLPVRKLRRPLVSASGRLPVGLVPIDQKHSLDVKGPIYQSIRLKTEFCVPHCNNKSIELGGSDPQSDQLFASHLIRLFYSLINEKKLKEIKKFISADCCFEELSFSKPFRGRMDVMHFLTLLADGMGDNIKFKIDKVHEGGEFAAGVIWHMEWKDKQIPFTRGCSFYECSKEGEKLVIKKGLVMTESPAKPGVLALRLLKIVRSAFDQFPNIADRFLLKPHAIAQFLQRIYKIFIEPLILPLLVYYTHLWTFVARAVGFLLSVILKILKFFK